MMAELDEVKGRALAVIDAHYGGLIAAEIGPLAALHAIKAAQAEAGVGPLVQDEDDRQAILSNVDALAARLAPIEKERRAAKASIRSADTLEAIMAAAMALPIGKEILASL